MLVYAKQCLLRDLLFFSLCCCFYFHFCISKECHLPRDAWIAEIVIKAVETISNHITNALKIYQIICVQWCGWRIFVVWTAVCSFNWCLHLTHENFPGDLCDFKWWCITRYAPNTLFWSTLIQFLKRKKKRNKIKTEQGIQILKHQTKSFRTQFHKQKWNLLN